MEDPYVQKLQLRIFWQWQLESTYGVVYAVAAAVESTSPIADKAWFDYPTHLPRSWLKNVDLSFVFLQLV